MNYRHSFHAGNFADVFKHVLLLRLLRAQQRKDKGFLFLDTHAGRGAYDLNASPGGRADRAPEWPQGIGRLWTPGTVLPPALAEYVELVRRFNAQHGFPDAPSPRLYPGSPWMAAWVRRPQDRLAFWELQPEEAAALRSDLGWSARTAVECGDGYHALRALLPPPERRALILIDPPFESADEFGAIARAVGEGLRRMPDGVFAVWYPLTARAAVDGFRDALRALRPPPTIAAELEVTGSPQVRMKGCGLIILNPPWKFADELASILPALVAALGHDPGAASHWDWLVAEQ
jgi:23S rRNA (adenine2030-N6)-methyltransferase